MHKKIAVCFVFLSSMLGAIAIAQPVDCTGCLCGKNADGTYSCLCMKCKY